MRRSTIDQTTKPQPSKTTAIARHHLCVSVQGIFGREQRFTLTVGKRTLFLHANLLRLEISLSMSSRMSLPGTILRTGQTWNAVGWIDARRSAGMARNRLVIMGAV
jgi:hypothetical protein